MEKARGFILVSFMFLAIAGSVSAGSPFSETIFTDDWTHHAIAELGRGRHIPDFVILPEMSRYQSALMVVRFLQYLAGEDQIESRRFGVSKEVYLENIIFEYNEKAAEDQMLKAGEVESLYALVLEFRQELEILGYAVQDFKWLFERRAEEGELFPKRPLLYSEEAVAAARRQEEGGRQMAVTADSPGEAEEVFPAATERRSLWTGQFAFQNRYLPMRSSLVVLEPLPEEAPALQLGGIELRGGVRPVESGVQALQGLPPAEGGAGYGISVKYGDLALSTAIDRLALEQSQSHITSTSVDLQLNWPDLFVLSAGYKHVGGVGDLLTEKDDVLPTITSLGVEVPLFRGKVSLGVTQEWESLNLFEALELNNASGKTLPKSTAELGLSYELSSDSALRLNYKFIDFSDIEYETTAEFSIKF